MKIKQNKLFSLGFLGILASLFVIFIKISPFRCCGCPPEGYTFYPLTVVLIENRLAWFADCFCPPGAGCVKSYYIIPFDLLSIGFILLALSFTNFKISLSKTLLILLLLALLGIGLSISILLFSRVSP